jgi:hypothetical protein
MLKLRARLFALVLLSLTGLGLISYSNSSVAQLLDVKTISQLPTYLGAMDHDTFIALTDVHKEIPMDDKSLSYSVRLPKAWDKKVDHGTGAMSHISEKVLGEIVRYYSPSDFYTISRFSITALALEDRITARNWFLNHVMVNGYVLQGMKVLSDYEVEGLYVLIEGDTSYSVRSKAVISGSRMFIVSYYVPYNTWEKDDKTRAMQERSISSFRFLSPDIDTTKLTQDFQFLNLVKFEYPSTWRLTSRDTHSIEGASVRILNTKNSNLLEGQIGVDIVSTESETTISQEIALLRNKLAEYGFKIKEVIEQEHNYNFDQHIYFNRVEAYSVDGIERSTIDHEYWIAVLVEDRHFYVVTLLTPSRLHSFYNWAINSEAFQTVIESIGPYVSESDLERIKRVEEEKRKAALNE